MNILKRFKFSSLIFLILLLVISVSFCKKVTDEVQDDGSVEDPDKVWAEENKLLNDTFRIDISDIDVVFTFIPGEVIVYGRAIIQFKMRDKEVFPIFHFEPALQGAVSEISLDNEILDFSDTSDIEIKTFDETIQKGIEIERDCSDKETHKLVLKYVLKDKFTTGKFYTDVNDIWGKGNEYLFPTINTPGELARHRITFIVKSDEEYRCIGSGKVTDISDDNVQKWQLDTEREVASYTVMFFLIPESESDFMERTVNGIDVRIMGYKNGASIEDAFLQLEEWLPELERKLGKFPMPRGLSVFLTMMGGGMEYYGGTISSLSALKHEVFHMYFGCSLIAKTYRDSWWDEAINMWYEMNAEGNLSPISDSFRSNIVSGRTPVSIGFDDRAYTIGAQIIEYCSQESGGREEFISFLSYLYENYTFSPFNTLTLVKYFRDFSGIDMNSKFLNWLYNGLQSYYSSGSEIWKRYHKVDLTPPEWILKKYGK